jgi:hypothetical protein
VVESTALEMRRTGNRTVGSNPTLSAICLGGSTAADALDALLLIASERLCELEFRSDRRDLVGVNRRRVVAP